MDESAVMLTCKPANWTCELNLQTERANWTCELNLQTDLRPEPATWTYELHLLIRHAWSQRVSYWLYCHITCMQFWRYNDSLHQLADLRTQYTFSHGRKSTKKDRIDFIASLPPQPGQHVTHTEHVHHQPPTRTPQPVFSLSVTIINPGDDLPLDAWHALEEWMDNNILSGAFGLERGDSEHNLHAQGVVRISASHVGGVTIGIKSALRATCPNVHVRSKSLTNQGSHTYPFLLGYVQKVRNQHACMRSLCIHGIFRHMHTYLPFTWETSWQ